MAYSPGDLRREIRDIIASRLDAGRDIIRGWLEHDVLSRHPLPPMFHGRDFDILCRKLAVSHAVLEVLRDLKLADKDPDSVSGSGTMPLPGFKHLQLGYPITRRDRKGHPQLVIVPIQNMTNVERWAKAHSYRKMASGCVEHAEELERYATSMSA